MGHVKRYAGVLIAASLIIGIGWALLSLALRSPADKLDPRAPEAVPSWLEARAPGQPVVQAGSTHLPYTDQVWCVFSAVPAPCVVLYQMPLDLSINTEGKEPVQVDGVQGWLWRLGPEEFMQQQDGASLSPETIRPALLEEFDSDADVFRRAAPYRQLYGSWREEGEEVSGDAIALQWNKDGRHYLLAGPLRSGITEDVLLTLANSLKPVDALDIREFPGNPGA